VREQRVRRVREQRVRRGRLGSQRGGSSRLGSQQLCGSSHVHREPQGLQASPLQATSGFPRTTPLSATFGTVVKPRKTNRTLYPPLCLARRATDCFPGTIRPLGIFGTILRRQGGGAKAEAEAEAEAKTTTV